MASVTPPAPSTSARVVLVRDSCENGAKGGVHVALSDNEQRILRQIEEQLETDTRFAQAVSPAGLYRHSARTVRWAVLGVLMSLVATVALLQVHFMLAFVGFLGMLFFVLVIERQLRAIGKAGIQDIAATIRTSRLNAQNIREKFSRGA